MSVHGVMAWDRPGNLLWVGRQGEPGVLVTGNLGNGLITSRWDATDANVVLPLTDVAEQALVNWFDLLHGNSRPLNLTRRRPRGSACRTAPRRARASGAITSRSWPQMKQRSQRRS